MNRRSAAATDATTQSKSMGNKNTNASPFQDVRIVTASWFTPLPDGHFRIGISRGVPRRMLAGYRMYRKLSPGSWFKSVDEAEYQRRYFEEVLRPLDPTTVVRELGALGGGATSALCCFERANDGHFCHRAFVSAWLHDTLGLILPELERADDGHGWLHPKLPRSD